MTPAAVVAAALAASAVLSIFAFLLSRGQSQAGEMARRLNQYGGDTVVTAPPRVKTGNAIRDLLDGFASAGQRSRWLDHDPSRDWLPA